MQYSSAKKTMTDALLGNFALTWKHNIYFFNKLSTMPKLQNQPFFEVDFLHLSVNFNLIKSGFADGFKTWYTESF
jgi:hypothetical protein